MRSHTTWHKWTHPTWHASTRFTYPGGMEGWVDLTRQFTLRCLQSVVTTASYNPFSGIIVVSCLYCCVFSWVHSARRFLARRRQVRCLMLTQMCQACMQTPCCQSPEILLRTWLCRLVQSETRVPTPCKLWLCATNDRCKNRWSRNASWLKRPMGSMGCRLPSPHWRNFRILQ